MSTIRFRYFEQSMTSATLQHWPARLVPPPRMVMGAPKRRAAATDSTTSCGVRGTTTPIGTWRSLDRSVEQTARLPSPKRLDQSGVSQEAGDPPAARDVGLNDVERLRFEEQTEVGWLVTVLSARDLHPGRCAVAQQPQPRHVGAHHRLFEPGDAHLRESVGKRERLFAVVRAVRVHEQLDSAADRLARGMDARQVALGLPADLHLHHGE